MKETTLRKLEDGATFKLSLKSKVTYTLIMKEKDGVIFTSNSSNRSFKKAAKTIIYV